MAYPKNRDAYPRSVELIVNGLAIRTQKTMEERQEGDEIFKYECEDETEAKALRYAIYGWINLLMAKGTKEEKDTARYAQRWKISTNAHWLICKERESVEQLKKVMMSLAEQGML